MRIIKIQQYNNKEFSLLKWEGLATHTYLAVCSLSPTVLRNVLLDVSV